MADVLVAIELIAGIPTPSALPAIAFARQLAGHSGGRVIALVLSADDAAAASLGLAGVVDTVRLVRSPALTTFRADVFAAEIANQVRAAGGGSVVAPATAFGRDVIPAVAALLDLPMVSDVTGMAVTDAGPEFMRPMFAGNLVARVAIEGSQGAFTVRTTAFGAPPSSASPAGVETAEPLGEPPTGSRWIGLESSQSARPDLTAARVVVSGGRPLRDAETFERLLGGLADRLGGALGATRAAVDSGIAPNELQVGQTGKVVAPDLYIAAGVSGSIQHMAGMKDSRVIVAINTDPDAPIFGIADYGLVADLHQAIPEMTAKL